MKRILLIVVSTLICYTNYAQVKVDTVHVNQFGLERVLVEKIPVPAGVAAGDANLSENAVTYRLFADMEQGYKWLAVTTVSWKVPNINMQINSTQPFYNETAFGGTTPIAPNFYQFAAALEYDTYVTNGVIGNNHVGVLRSVDPAGYIAITPSTTPIGSLTIQNMSGILTDNASTGITSQPAVWSSPAVPGPDAATNIFFMGQFTTAGEFDFLAAIAIQNPKGGYNTVENVIYPSMDAPMAKITAPKNDTVIVVGENIDILVNATDTDSEIDSVEFFINGTKIGVDQTKPYAFTWPGVAGFTWIKAVAVDETGMMGTDSVKILVNSPTSIAITAPAEGSEFLEDDTVTIQANVVDLDGIDSVEFFVREVKIGAANSTPYMVKWVGSFGPVDITAVSTDNFGTKDTADVVNVSITAKESFIYISEPAANHTEVEGKAVMIKAVVKDFVQVDSVQFRIGASRIGSVPQSMLTNDTIAELNWKASLVGALDLIALSYNTDTIRNSDTIAITINANMPPVVAITAPTKGSIFETGEFVSIAVSATDTDGGIDSVSFYINNARVGTSKLFPFAFDWISIEGAHEIKAIAYDVSGASDTSDIVNITVNDPPKPVASIVSPVNNAQLIKGDTVTIEANATVEDGTIDNVMFYVNNTLAGSDANAPYTIKWVAKQTGTFSIKAVAVDDAASTDTSDVVTVTVIENKKPNLSIANPTAGARFKVNDLVNIDALASDAEGSVDSVVFFVNNIKIATDTQAPYASDWTANATGDSAIKAIAYDDRGLDSSLVVNIAVDPISALGINESLSSLVVYPNPATEQCLIDIAAHAPISKIEYYVFDIQGKVVDYNVVKPMLTQYQVVLDVAGYAPGQYQITMNIDGDVVTKHITKK